jgi:hypothetical protein
MVPMELNSTLVLQRFQFGLAPRSKTWPQAEPLIPVPMKPWIIPTAPTSLGATFARTGPPLSPWMTAIWPEVCWTP